MRWSRVWFEWRDREEFAGYVGSSLAAVTPGRRDEAVSAYRPHLGAALPRLSSAHTAASVAVASACRRLLTAARGDEGYEQEGGYGDQ
jgi:hypothetical protein